MSETLSLSGIDYIPASRAGKNFGYTGDYISKLAREGQVEGTKVGHQWFVTEASVKDFVENKTKVKSERSEAIRLARKEELKASRVKLEAARKERVNSHHMIALTQTLVILVIGLSLGASGYVMTTPKNQSASLATASYSAIERLALSVYTFITGGEKVEIVTEMKVVGGNDTASEMSQETWSVSAEETVGTTTHTSIVIAPEEVFTASTVEAVRDSFSDDVSVSVDPLHPDTGIIVPHFKEKDGESYRFLMVPVTPESGG